MIFHSTVNTIFFCFNFFVLKFITSVLKFITYKFEDMRTINPNSNDIDSFKYSILISLHYNDIPNNPQRRSNLNKYESQHNFSHTEPIQFE